MANYTSEVQQLIITQIKLEFQASHIYRGLSYFFNHPEIAYPGFAKYFHNEAEEELTHAESFIKYHQDRGCFVHTPKIRSFDSNLSIVEALKYALRFEQKVLKNLIMINQISDSQTQVFIEDYISMQTKSISELTSLLSKTKRVKNNPIGLYLLDKELQ